MCANRFKGEVTHTIRISESKKKHFYWEKQCVCDLTCLVVVQELVRTMLDGWGTCVLTVNIGPWVKGLPKITDANYCNSLMLVNNTGSLQ